MNGLEKLKSKPNIKKIIETIGGTPEEIEQKQKQRKKENYEGAEEAWIQNLSERNNLNNLIWATLIAISSSIVMQTIFEIIKEVSVKENLIHLYILIFEVGAISFLIFIFIILKSIQQIDYYIRYHKKIMKENKI